MGNCVSGTVIDDLEEILMDGPLVEELVKDNHLAYFNIKVRSSNSLTLHSKMLYLIPIYLPWLQPN